MAVRNQFFVEDGRLTPGKAPTNQKLWQQVPELQELLDMNKNFYPQYVRLQTICSQLIGAWILGQRYLCFNGFLCSKGIAFKIRKIVHIILLSIVNRILLMHLVVIKCLFHWELKWILNDTDRYRNTNKRLYVHRKRDAYSLSTYLCSNQGSTISLPLFITCPLCFLIAYNWHHVPAF